MDKAEFKFDQIGCWSEIKLDIVREYAAVYSKILSARTNPSLYHLYVDAFAGAGVHLSRTTGEFVLGSPLNALSVKPPFREFHFIDLDREKVSALRELVKDRSDTYVWEGDCNQLLHKEILPRCRYKDYRRALWLLDPYKLQLNWSVIEMAGREETIDIFLNFPVMDMNRSVLWRDPSKVHGRNRARMDAYWGDHSWQEISYTTNDNLFGWQEKADIETIVQAFRERLKKVAGFANVPRPIPMRNTKGASNGLNPLGTRSRAAQKSARAVSTAMPNVWLSVYRRWDNLTMLTVFS
jgi:three-Cys-motif partner protein